MARPNPEDAWDQRSATSTYMDIFNPILSSAGTKQAAAPLEDGHPRSTVVVGSACVVCSDFVSTVTIVWDLDVRGPGHGRNWWNEQRANTNTGSLFWETNNFRQQTYQTRKQYINKILGFGSFCCWVALPSRAPCYYYTLLWRVRLSGQVRCCMTLHMSPEERAGHIRTCQNKYFLPSS